MATDSPTSSTAPKPPPSSSTTAATSTTSSTPEQLPIRPPPSQQTHHQDGSAAFDIVRAYHDLLATDPDITMPVAAIESLIELLRATPSTTAMETVEVVKKEKARLLASAPNPLPLLAGADLFEQYLLRSLRGQAASASDPILNFDETRAHLLHNSQLFAQRAKADRDKLALVGSKYVHDGKVVLAAGGSRVVTKILLRAAADPTKHFKVILIMDGSPRSASSVAALRHAGLEVETISPNKVAYVLKDQSQIDLVLVGTEAVLQNGGIVSRMGTFQLAHLTKHVKGALKRFFVAAETHKIVRKTALAHPQVLRLGVNQKDISRFENVGRDRGQISAAAHDMVAEQDEVDYTDPEFIDGFITEQGVKMTTQIWEMIDDYI
ncbi:hypothetical protein B0T19DRAFT_464041 [Cercophora scortea]|uniref:Translation initiation factor eIF2B subunit alpha n=1 Tax=Cercophora scortea TaxID=314031 RepID=A0AAE0MA34_9PEZI|nr:hypothetical protein B0T19DRAFT_464041 [Cercophora scortea]